MRRLVLLALLSGCATLGTPTPYNLHQEAVTIVADCANSSYTPFQEKDNCVPDGMAYCAAHGIKCDPNELWTSAEFQLQDR
jgi:hypothetical protein